MAHGGQVLAGQLAALGVRRVFSVPGESFLAALDGLHASGIDNVVCRQEGGAAMMAEATAKLTGQPGVVFVTRGPGATNAAAGLHVAMQDGTPLVAFVGQVPLAHRDRGAFQEVDYRRFLGPLVKWVAEVETPARLEEYVARAFHVAMAGRPGPVVLALPEDVLSAQTPARGVLAQPVARTALDPDLARGIVARMTTARSGLIVAGGTPWQASTGRKLAHLADRTGLPVAVTFRRQDYIDNAHPCYAGDLGVGMNPALLRRLERADRVLLIGAELDDTATGAYAAHLSGEVIQIHPEAERIGRVYAAGLSAVCTPEAALDGLLAAAPEAPSAPRDATARAAYEDWQRPARTPGAVKLEQVIVHMARALPGDAIVTNGAGNYAAFLHRYYRYRRYGTQLAPTCGSMGYGLPAAIAAKLEHPDRAVICLAGDGCLQMTSQELSTAAQHGAAVVVIVADNGRYGTIRMHQERTYPGRVSGTDLVNPDFAGLARVHGGQGWVVEEGAAFPAALREALDSGGLAIVHLRLDPDMLTTSATLSDLEKQQHERRQK